jgi:hypothetical protein
MDLLHVSIFQLPSCWKRSDVAPSLKLSSTAAVPENFSIRVAVVRLELRYVRSFH